MAQSGNEELVRAIAHRVYLNRQVWRRSGDAHDDWQTATIIAEKPLKRLLFWGHSGLLALPKLGYRSAKFVVWEIPNWGLFSLPKLEWVKLLAVPLVVAAAGSIITRNFQREAEQNRILKEYFALLETFTFEQGLLDEPLDSGVVLLARGRTVATLRELDLSRREQLIAFLRASDLATIETNENTDETDQSPSRADENANETDENSGTFREPVISFKNQDLSEMDLQNINSSSLDFQSTSLGGANLQNAVLWYVNLRDARLGAANLQDAFLLFANLQDANLRNANLQGAVLLGADLQDAFLESTNLQGVDFFEANLRNAHLERANLQGAFLEGASLQGASLISANLQDADLEGALELTEEQFVEAVLCGTILPEYIDLDGNRDCDSP